MRSALDWVSRHFRPVAVGLAVLGLALALWAQRQAVSAVDWTVRWPGVVAAVSLFAVSALGGCLAFWLILHDLTGSSSLRDTTLVWVRSFLARYVPSGALTIAVRVRARERLGAQHGQIWSASAYEQVASALAGATVTVTAFSLADRSPPLTAWLVLASALLVAFGFRRRVAAQFLLRMRGGRVDEAPLFTGPWVMLGAAFFDVLGWLAAGTAVWVLVDSILPGEVSAPFLIAAYAFSWLLGFLALPVPSGFGVREATFIAVLAPTVGAGAATVLALAVRLADILGEILLFLCIEAMCRFERRPPTRMVTS